MADGLNSVLEESQLSLFLCQGVIRLLPKVKGAPLTSQLRSITLLSFTEYKLLTKAFIAWMKGVLQSLLQKSQLCLVTARNIMQGPFLSGSWQSSSGRGGDGAF
jgi:hypothetical protein